jgi:ribosomal protein S12 methylthiotransferase
MVPDAGPAGKWNPTLRDPTHEERIDHRYRRPSRNENKLRLARLPQALVDSERIITRLRAEGYELARGHTGADLAIVNTCGFLESAQVESLGAIGEALAHNGKVIVTGCMGAEPEKITARYPNVLAVTGPQQYESVVEAVHRALPPLHEPFLDLVPPQGIKLTPRHYAYLKISEGCNNRCTFCIIPKLRGDLARPAADVLREAERLVTAGVKELLVISQDTSAYGVDLKHAPSNWNGRAVPARSSISPARSASSGSGAAALRLSLPARGRGHPLMAEGKVLPYRHPVPARKPGRLKRMKRPAAQEKTLERIHAGAKSALISPSARPSSLASGETDADFQLLLDWLEEAELTVSAASATSRHRGGR